MKFSVTKQRSRWWTVSATVILIGLISAIVSFFSLGYPLKPGLDFVGGTRLQLELDCTLPNNCDRPIQIGQVRQVVAEQGLENSSIQVVGEERNGLSIRSKVLDTQKRTQLIDALSAEIGEFDRSQIRIDTVGPTIGRQIFVAGLLSLLVALAGIILYVSIRFQFDYALFAIVALFHDVLVTLGVFSVLGLVAGLEIDSLFLVALLTIIGFSVNDTVVIYDRIREKSQRNPNESIASLVDSAVNETLTRSINTTLTSLLSLVAILLFGGETLKDFALALIVGFISGAYSSIFIAGSLLEWWRQRTGKPLTDPKFADSSGGSDATSTASK
ncbi:protein translocase subunit SecF [Geitlerinema sp. PCC 9228]|jgi:preprotein translocase subunit SecF|uniref:protein translocase subunit SecF n=1 Tax=Geitlerinema sp. PCC 9228 TaxID=111611 RepID=UPI0008F9854E|nr:protein translocase subunit SecF [Geitlerinema sp. PCC 9228]